MDKQDKIIEKITVLAIVLSGSSLWGCSSGPEPFHLVDADTVDTSDSTDTDSDADTDADSDADTDADTDADSDADTDADTDTDADSDTDTDVIDACPWTCRPIADEPEFTCDDYEQPDEPDEVFNPNYFCPLLKQCCQPWPPTDDQGIGEYCNDFDETQCSTVDECLIEDIDKTKICFWATSVCCPKGGPDDHNYEGSKATIRQN